MIVEMYRIADSGNDPSTNPAHWVYRLPNGAVVDGNYSPTQGLQEAINYAADHGYQLFVRGGGIAAKNGQDVAIIRCSNPIVVPPLQGAKWEIHASIHSTAFVEAVLIDSLMATDLAFYGQIVRAHPGVGVNVSPFNLLPNDTAAGACITASRLRLPSVVVPYGSVAIDFNARYGAISGNIIEILEPNGGAVGVRVRAGLTTVFAHNTINVREVHGQDTCVDAGGHGGNYGNIYGNIWTVQCSPRTGGVGVEVRGRNERWTIAVDKREGQPTTGVTLNPGSAKNLIDLILSEATVPVNEASGGKNTVLVDGYHTIFP